MELALALLIVAFVLFFGVFQWLVPVVVFACLFMGALMALDPLFNRKTW